MKLPDSPPRLLILGAGPTGLGAAYRLLQEDYGNWAIFEKNAFVGGLSASCEDEDGFTWDIGGHVVFSHYKEFDRFFQDMTRGEVFNHQRKSYIRMAGRYIPYPFQNNIRHLPEEMQQRCLQGLEEAALREEKSDRSNFLNWNLSRQGEGITRLFIEPDNLKRWTLPLEQLSADWVADRVSPVDVDRIRENIRLERDDISWGPNNTFQFPRKGGTGAIFAPMAERMGKHFFPEKEVIEINPDQKQVVFADGERERYDALLSTLPLDQLVNAIPQAPEDLKERACQLQHCDGYIVGIGFSRPCPSDKCWIYCPEEEAPFFRATYFSNYSPYNAPDENHYSIMCDCSHSPHRPLDKETIIDDCLNGLYATGVIGQEDLDAVVSTVLLDVPYTYPIPTLDRDEILEELHGWLEPRNIHSRGRMGSWLYEIGNMDHSVVMGMQWVEALLHGKREKVWLDRH